MSTISCPSTMLMSLLINVLAASVCVYGQKAPDTSIELSFQTEQLQRSAFGDADFVFNFEKDDISTPGGSLRGLFVNNDAVLATLPGEGVGQNLVTLNPCAINQPHVHPRGTEISWITQGDLLFGFVEENGGRFISANMTVGQSVIIPQGLMHFAQNLGCKPARFLATFPNRDPGTLTIASNFFGKLPAETLRATLGLSDDHIASIKAVVAQQLNPSVDQDCLKRCGYSSPGYQSPTYSPSSYSPSSYSPPTYNPTSYSPPSYSPSSYSPPKIYK